MPRYLYGIEVPDAIQIENRIYYDDDGNITHITKENLPGKYIVVDTQTAINPGKFARVVDGKIVNVPPESTAKLKPSESGTPCHDKDVSIVSDSSEAQHWEVKNDPS